MKTETELSTRGRGQAPAGRALTGRPAVRRSAAAPAGTAAGQRQARLANPARPPAPAWPGVDRSHPAAGRRAPAARMPFVLLILSLLGGGLVCLLVINTTLATASFTISNLQQGNAALSQQQQALQQQIAQEESPASIEQRAYRLGLREQQVLSFLDVQTHRIYTQPSGLSGVPGAAGSTP